MSNIRSLRDLQGDGDNNPGAGGRGRPGPQTSPPPQQQQQPGGPGMLGGLFNFFGSPAPAPGGAAPAGGHGGRVRAVNEQQLRQELTRAGNKLVVVDYSATWCGPCKAIAPIVEQLSEQYPGVVFLSVDIDQNQSLASEAGISGVPTFQFYKNGRVFEQFSGANAQKLRSLVQTHAGPSGAQADTGAGAGSSSSWGSSGGHRLGDAPPPSAAPLPQQPQQQTGQAAAPYTVPDAPEDSAAAVMLPDLLEMGFPEAQAKRALEATKCRSLEDALDWLSTHQDGGQAEPMAVDSGSTAPDNAAAAIAAVVAAAAAAAATPDATPDATPAAAGEKKPEGEAPVLHDAMCNVCMKQIVGKRWKCKVCPDFDLCDACRANPAAHDASHELDEVAAGVRPAMTPDEVALYQKRMKERLIERRTKQAAEEERAKVDRELSRRRTGQEIAETKEKIKEAQRVREEAAARMEREEAKVARDRVLQQIAQDKAERAARRTGSTPTQSPPPGAAAPAPAAPKVYTETTLQVRLPDGSALRQSFPVSATVGDVFEFAATASSGKLVRGTFTLAIPMPRRVFTTADRSVTLSQAGLVPNGNLVVGK